MPFALQGHEAPVFPKIGALRFQVVSFNHKAGMECAFFLYFVAQL